MPKVRKDGEVEMRLYRKLIRPVHCYPGQGYEPKTEPVEKIEIWYPEEERERLEKKYGYLNEGHFSDLIFEEKYEPFPLKEPELTDRQLEDIAYEDEKAYDNGYVKGFHDAKTLEEHLVEFGIKIGFLTPEKAEQLLKEHKPINSSMNCGEVK